MKTITVKEFYGGMTEDRYGGSPGQFSLAKHFDILTHPRRLQPLRGMASHTANTGIGNLIVGSNGSMYGVGTDANNPGNGKLWVLSDFGGSGNFAALSTNQLSGAAVKYDLLVDYPDCGNVRSLHWASNNVLIASDPAGGSSASTQSLTFSTIGQGFVHPKDKILYIPYRTTSASYIATVSSNATPFGSFNATAFTSPSMYRTYCLSNYGNYLAIPATATSTTYVPNASIVYLSDRDTSQSTFAESIPWGSGYLKVLNNLSGVLIGISEGASDSSSAQDFSSLQIKVFEGGTEPRLVKEIKAIHLAGGLGGSAPTVTINPRVNFIKADRLYFSATVNPNDGVQPSFTGLWSVGRNKVTGDFSVTLERVATDANSETAVIAAAAAGDYFEMVHTAEGTLTKSINGSTSNSTYSATSVYESAVNPDMPDNDLLANKRLASITVHYLPLPSGAAVTVKYRTDSNGGTADWISVGANAASETVAMERIKASTAEFTAGRNFEFRLESTGGAVITGYTYKYDLLPTNQ